MLSRNKFLFRFIIIIFAFLCCFTPSVINANAQTEELYLGGFPAGFALNTTNVQVVGMCDVMTESGIVSPAREAGIKTGDVIEKINGSEVKSSEDVNAILGDSCKLAIIVVERDGQSMTLTAFPAKDAASGKMRLGILVKDSLNGVGTITYIDKKAGKFGSLGHPVTDTSNNTVSISGGTLYGCVIYDVKRGVRGTPGELKGAFENGKIIGKATANTPSGVFGELNENYDVSGLKRVQKGNINDVTPGAACIYSTVDAKNMQCYDISIVKVDKNNKDRRNFVIKIEDKDLIAATGGIVQGMSGSPIVQNGKLIGAVTHVFINDPTRGYGISIENMMNSCE